MPNKTHINHAAKQNGLYDSNYANNFTDIANRFFIKSDGTFKLNPAGFAELKNILSEMQNSTINGCEYWNSTRRSVNRTPKITQEEQQEVEQWLQRTSMLDNFDVRSLGTTVNYAIFALYVITKELKVADLVKPGIAYEYLVRKYKTISLKKKNFSDTLGQKKYTKYFSRTPEGCYYLEPEAENLVENLLNQGSVKIP